MEKHRKKMIAPIVITVITILYLLGFGWTVIREETSAGTCILGVVILLVLCGVMIAVLTERIREIRSGEEDDLSKY